MFEVEKVEGTGWNVETDESGLCSSCKEWAGATFYLTEDFEIDEVVSNCCSAPLHHFHVSNAFKEAVIDAAKNTARDEVPDWVAEEKLAMARDDAAYE